MERPAPWEWEGQCFKENDLFYLLSLICVRVYAYEHKYPQKPRKASDLWDQELPIARCKRCEPSSGPLHKPQPAPTSSAQGLLFKARHYQHADVRRVRGAGNVGTRKRLPEQSCRVARWIGYRSWGWDGGRVGVLGTVHWRGECGFCDWSLERLGVPRPLSGRDGGRASHQRAGRLSCVLKARHDPCLFVSQTSTDTPAGTTASTATTAASPIPRPLGSH